MLETHCCTSNPPPTHTHQTATPLVFSHLDTCQGAPLFLESLVVPVMRYPVMRHPVMCHPFMRHPVMRHPVMCHPVMRHPVMCHPVMRHPAMRRRFIALHNSALSLMLTIITHHTMHWRATCNERRWCQFHTKGFDGVAVTNLTKSWQDGTCHHCQPPNQTTTPPAFG